MSETLLACGLVVHINLVIACFVQASDDRLLKMRIDHHNQQLLRLINRLLPIIGTSLELIHYIIVFLKRDRKLSNVIVNTVMISYIFSFHI